MAQENAKPKPSLERIAAAMNRYLVPAALAQPKKKDEKPA